MRRRSQGPWSHAAAMLRAVAAALCLGWLLGAGTAAEAQGGGALPWNPPGADPSAPRVRIDFWASEPRLRLEAVLSRHEMEGSVEGWRVSATDEFVVPVCVAPCSLLVPAGDYRLKVEGVDAGLVPLRTDARADVILDRALVPVVGRALGVVLFFGGFGTALVVGALWGLSVLDDEHEPVDGIRDWGGWVTAASGGAAVLGLLLALSSDEAEVRVRPYGR